MGAGLNLSREMPSIYRTVEHWRSDLSWWEYCLLRKEETGTYINSWRIRPIVLLRENDKGGYKPHRLWGGMSHYFYSFASIFFGVISWIIVFFYFSILSS